MAAAAAAACTGICRRQERRRYALSVEMPVGLVAAQLPSWEAIQRHEQAREAPAPAAAAAAASDGDVRLLLAGMTDGAAADKSRSSMAAMAPALEAAVAGVDGIKLCHVFENGACRAAASTLSTTLGLEKGRRRSSQSWDGGTPMQSKQAGREGGRDDAGK